VAVYLALAVVVGLGSAALAWSQARRTAAPTGGDPAALAKALKRVPVGERLAELQRRTAPGTWEHELAVDALAAPDESARVAAVNLALAEVEHTLTMGAGWPRAGVRIALLGAAFLAFAAYVGGNGQVQAPLVIVAVGALAALTSVEAGRSAERNAARQRVAIDELIAAALGDPLEAADRATHSSARWRGAEAQVARTPAPGGGRREPGPARRLRRRGPGGGS
jgi:hypothetical protein